MKSTIQLSILLFLGFQLAVYAQDTEETEQYEPVYITMTTTHWSDDPDTDFSGWLDTEKEYFEKVTSKNDLILSSGVYTHYFTPDNSEVVLVNVYRTWNDIEEANSRTEELIAEGWKDEESRKKFFEKQQSYYSADHRDEIYQSMQFSIPETVDKENPKIYYVRTADLSMNGEGTPENFKQYYENITKKSKKLKGYYTHRHLWGSNAREMNEVFVFDKLGDIEEFFEEEQGLVNSHWTDEDERSEFMEEMTKLFTGKHGDYVYRNVPSLMK
ncbi:hypothetical protein ACNKXS_10715 [Christiangramia marina]|uniref:hypothetical protein n=1 Tax=Christiangramia marina TaxID=409436 RepID=UPI003AA7CBCF